ncbi:inositol monophosphatase family protein, partial [Bacteroidota bacterium]
MVDVEKACLQTIDLCREVGKFINSNVNKISSDIIETKSKNSFVTYVDKTAERSLVKGLLKIIPEAGFITEEKTINKKGEKYNWVIDPLDGTTNYIHGLPPYSISIGLLDQKEIVMGVILELCLNECFYTWKDGDAFLDGKKISVSKVPKISDSLFATGFPYCEFDHLDEYIKLFTELMKQSQGIRRLGSAAVDLAYVACGRFDGFFEYGLNPWDVSAGGIIIKQAGGIVTDFAGESNFLFG